MKDLSNLPETDGLTLRRFEIAPNRAEPEQALARVSPFGEKVLGAFDDDRRKRAQLVFQVAQVLWEAARISYPEMAFFEDSPEDAIEAVVLLDNYDRNRQWSPFPVGTPAAHDRQLQSKLADIAGTLLGSAPGNPNAFALVPRPREGWASGKRQPRHTDREIETAALMGYGAWRELGNQPFWTELGTDDWKVWRERATKVLTLAKIHQIDAIRVALLEHQIDPRFSGPIVADVAFGGPTRRI